ncbi:MAG: ferrous iron transport protein A [Spirochaetaceae bacterium]|nr:MAG: ferrous iron transport protein A [Spirochaetaceae bacterium]
MTLSEADLNVSYFVADVSKLDPEVQEFLATLGCYVGQEINLVSRVSDNFIISLRNSRYSIDGVLARHISVEPLLCEHRLRA